MANRKMGTIKVQIAFAALAILALPLMAADPPTEAQNPLSFDVSAVAVGSQRLVTVRAYATGKWSDASPDVRSDSTEVRCYKRFGFCEVANAKSRSYRAFVVVEDFDVLRWDNKEMIAVDSSPTCVVKTLRFDFVAKKVSLSSTSKGEKGGKFCGHLLPWETATAFLIAFSRDDPVRYQPN
jgi:hypothetical protein